MRKVTINGKELVLRHGNRSAWTYEAVTGAPFTGKTTYEVARLCHVALQVYNEDFSMSFDDFAELCEEHPEIMQDFVGVYKEFQEKELALLSDDKKKVTESR